MAHSNRLVSCFIALLVLLTGTLPARADQGKDLYDKQCAGCHSIGGGDGGGPDLKGVVEKRPADWLVKVIVEPEKLTASKDPVQAELIKKYGSEMPNMGISQDEAKKIIAFLAGSATASGSTPVSVKVETVVTPELVAKGRALFAGSARMVNGGAACASCHPFTYAGITGGNLSSKDLGTSYQKMGDSGMSGALKTLKFPTMKKIYADRQLTDDEIMALMALFKESATNKAGGTSVSLPLAGGGLFVVLLLGLFLYKRRIG